MTFMRYGLLAAWITAALTGWAEDTVVSSSVKWLAPNSGYSFKTSAGTEISLPSSAFGEWSYFNAPSSEVSKSTYTVKASDAADDPEMLCFADHGRDETTYLALGISANADDATQDPIKMSGSTQTVRMDNVYVRMRFAVSGEAPKVSDLQEMYASAEDRESGIISPAKLGVCVLDDDYFYVSRVRAGTATDPGTGLPEDYTYEFVQTNVLYADVGSGEVVLRIEFHTYENDGVYYCRAYRLFVQNASEADAEEKCLTDGLGYKWLVTDNGEYQFDFATLGEGAWLYAMDDAVAAAGGVEDLPDVGVADTPIDCLNHIAFSATEGGFHSAWLDVDKKVENVTALAAYDTGDFAAFVGNVGSMFDLYAAWAAEYNVTLSDWLQPQETTVRTVALVTSSSETSEATLTEHAFNAFLLYMDPETDEALRLNVTGIVTGEEEVSFTICGPEGCNLKKALNHAAQLEVRRAADIASIATAEAQSYELIFEADGTVVHVTMPKGDATGELPFMQAKLVPVEDVQ